MLSIVLAIIILASAAAAQTCSPHDCKSCSNKYNCLNGYYCRYNTCIKKGCFPGDTPVQISNGKLKLMHQLKIGDKVLVTKGHGESIYSDVYAFGHNDNSTISDFINLKVVDSAFNSNTLQVTGGHFLPTKSGYKQAVDLEQGDLIYGTTNSSTFLYKIIEITSVEKKGLFNPFTLTGTIVVGNTIASVHSEWFLDSTFNNLGIVGYLPYAYQAVLLPIRFLYNFIH